MSQALLDYDSCTATIAQRMPILRFVSVNHQTCPRLDHSGLNLASPVLATFTVNRVRSVTGTIRFCTANHDDVISRLISWRSHGGVVFPVFHPLARRSKADGKVFSGSLVSENRLPSGVFILIFQVSYDGFLFLLNSTAQRHCG